MPTGEIAPQQAMQVSGSATDRKVEAPTPPSMSPVNPALCEKVNFFGIEVFDKLVWKGWEPGKEYIKNMVLKNLGMKTLKFKFSNPETKFFTTLYPKPLFLSPGASFSLPITFKPLEHVAYDDKLIFTLKSGEQFEIPMKAILPQTDISIPIDLDFKMCAVKDYTSITFDVFNTGDVDTPLQWEVTEPFSIEPVEAMVKHRSSIKFRATFRPTCAKVYEATAVCRFGKDYELAGPTTFYGTGKYPHLLVSQPGKKAETANGDKLNAVETEINFGKVAVATSANLWVELHNLASVRTPFRVERIVGMNRMDTTFHCTQTQGIVPPMSLMKIPITFTPHSVGTTCIEYFSIISVGDVSRSIIKCVGSSYGPQVELDMYSINFGKIEEGLSGTQTLEIINNSDMEAAFEFELDCTESVFKFPFTSGVLKPHSHRACILKFVPQHPINYYRRVTLLVHNQLPLFLDLLGTCHSEVMKPAILRSEHIDRFHTHAERGLSIISPELLNELWKAGRLEEDKNGCLQAIFPSDKVGLVAQPSTRNLPPMDEYFNDGFHSDVMHASPYVSLNVNVVDFGNVQNLHIPEERTVSITNHTKGKMTVQWNGDSTHDFYVSPSCLDVPPLKACSFRVTFNAAAANKIYGNELECFVYYKALRDYRLVEDKTQCPPWCLTLKCMGHTFMPNNETFLPRAVITPSVVVFPAVNTGETAYQTFLVGNTGETPILYDLTKSLSKQEAIKSRCGTREQKENAFSVKPSQGILYCGYQVFTVKMSPTVINSFSHDLLMRLNDNSKYDQMIHLCGSAESAEVLLDGEGNMYFKPTCAGTVSTRTYGFKNVSRIPLRFQWKIKKEDQKCLKVEPENGTVLPNQHVIQSWSFTPAQEMKYLFKPTLEAWGLGLAASSSGGKKNTFSLRVIGEGSIGDIQTDQAYLDFGDIVVGSSSSRQINIFNNSNCSLQYRLIIEGLDDNSDMMASSMMLDRPGVEFDSTEGVLPARGKHSITATLRPVRRVTYQYSISYKLITPQYEIAHPSVQEPQHLIHLLATGVYPSMQVSDIRSQGSAIGISKKSLWGLFSVDSLNAYLNSDPSVDELMYNIVTRQSARSRPSQKTKAVLDFNFSAAPLGADPCLITIMFENGGTVPCEWAFMSPKDLQMEMGYWTESGDLDEDELHDMKVTDNKLFEIEPKKGLLKPGESITVNFTYYHNIAGTDRLPVLLKIAKGREIMLNFVGVTVDQDIPYIHFPANKHTFNPVPIGEKISPKQVYELYNGGAMPVTYECDLTPLDIIRKENFDQPIFECLNPTDQILPGQSAFVEWRFFPLEAKTYMVDIPIRVHNADTAIITFTGIGYDKRIMGDTMPFSDEPDVCGVPSVQSAEIPGQLAYLSAERISFGNMPLFAQARRMVFVRNKSKDRSIFFEWHVTSQSDSQFLNIFPIRGKIAPDSYKMCRVTFLACDVPSFYDLDLVCEISDLHEYTWYKRELVAWEAEKDRQLTEFTITEKDLHADMRTPHVVDLVDGTPADRATKLEVMAEGRPLPLDSELHKYKTLPPIRKLTVDEERELERQRQKKLSRLWQKPVQQKPFLLHLGITARTHDIHHFQTNFPDEYCHFFIDRTLSEAHQRQQQSYQAEESDRLGEACIAERLECSQGEANIIGSVLGNCLRGLLDDTYFIQAVKKVRDESIPYFRQFSDKLSRSMLTSSTPRVETRHSLPRVDTFKSEIELRESLRPQDPDTDLEENADDSVSMPETGALSNDHGDSGLSVYQLQVEDEENERLDAEAQALRDKQDIKKMPEFGNTMEQVLENTVLNLMYEALSSEYSIVSKPRFIAMPRKRLSATSKTSS